MGQGQIVNQTKQPNTRTTITHELKNMGVTQGMTLIIHSSLSSLGWVCGGATAVVQALIDAVGNEGTLVMPVQTADNSDPSDWSNPPVPREWWPTIRAEMPAFDSNVTPSGGMGKIAEAFRTFPGVKRSNHPTYSFAALGKHAEYIVSEQPLEAGFGPKSPLAKIYELDGFILLLGVKHDSNTSLHFAEHAIPNRDIVKKGSALFEGGERVWKRYKEIDYDSDIFRALGVDFEEIYEFSNGEIGNASCKLINQRIMIDFARDWLVKRSEI